MFYTNIERYKNVILFRGYDKKGNRVEREIRYKPKLYVPTKKATKWKSIYGLPVDSLEFESMYAASSYVKENSDISNFTIYGTTNFVHQFIAEMFTKDIQFDMNAVDVTSLDIEVEVDGSGFPDVEKAENVIDLITVKSTKNDRFFTWGLGDFKAPKGMKVKYEKCQDEAELLMHFLDWWALHYPDVVTGWNSDEFDLVYIINRIKRILGDKMAKKMSPWGILNTRTREAYGKTITTYDIGGIVSLDYMQLFKKFGYSYGTQESYKLDHIANVVLGDAKLDYSEYGSLFNLSKENHQKYVEYNIQDVNIVYRLEDKMGLIELAFTIAHTARCSLIEVFGTVGIWDAFINHECFKRKLILPPKKNLPEQQIAGGYVKEPNPGMYDWIVSYDLNSLYPMLICEYNMSPETIMEEEIEGVTPDRILNGAKFDIPSHCSMSARGNLFDNRKRGILPEIIDGLYSNRSVIKKEMLAAEQEKEANGKTYEIEKRITTLNNQQMAVKILMNSLFGAMANKYFRFYDVRIAESITLSGQLTIRWAERAINKKLNEITKSKNVDWALAIDTDSNYINFSDIVKKEMAGKSDGEIVEFLDRVSNKVIEPLLEETFDELKTRMNAYEQRMVMKREAIANRGIWTGKKRYIINVLNSEGVQYKEPKQKIVGIEAVRSSTPAICRDMIKETIKVIINENQENTQKYIAECKKKFMEANINDIAFPRSANSLDNYADSASIYRKGTPIQVRAALLYNMILDKKKLTNRYNKIYSGSKIKFIYLTKPNPIFEDVIGFTDYLPEEFELHKYIDKETQFDKAFLAPINNILDAIGWSHKKVSRLVFE